MASFVNAADIVAAAVEIERRGFGFYRRAENQAIAADKDFFAFMAEEEQRHETIFAAMLERIGGVCLPAGSDDEEYLAYVKSLLDSHSLFLLGQEEMMRHSPLLVGMQFEKDTLLFFMEMEKMVPDSEKKAVRACAAEERNHLKMLLGRM